MLVNVGADTTQLSQGMKAAEARVKQFGAGVGAATSRARSGFAGMGSAASSAASRMSSIGSGLAGGLAARATPLAAASVIGGGAAGLAGFATSALKGASAYSPGSQWKSAQIAKRGVAADIGLAEKYPMLSGTLANAWDDAKVSAKEVLVSSGPDEMDIFNGILDATLAMRDALVSTSLDLLGVDSRSQPSIGDKSGGGES